jgi:hypothetical protein
MDFSRFLGGTHPAPNWMMVLVLRIPRAVSSRSLVLFSYHRVFDGGKAAKFPKRKETKRISKRVERLTWREPLETRKTRAFWPKTGRAAQFSGGTAVCVSWVSLHTPVLRRMGRMRRNPVPSLHRTPSLQEQMKVKNCQFSSCFSHFNGGSLHFRVDRTPEISRQAIIVWI